MDLVRWYATLIAGLIGVSFLLRHGRATTKACTYICLRIAYTLQQWHLVRVVSRAVVLVIWFAVNISIMASSDVMIRSGMLASVNLVLLFLGGRTSFLPEFLGVPLDAYYLAHHWIGRTVVLQGLLHAGLAVSSIKQARADPSGITVSILLVLIFIASLRFVRRWAFQLFLYAHNLLALLAVGGLLWHLLLPGISIKILFPILALVLWLCSLLSKLCRTRVEGRVETFEKTPCSAQASIADAKLTAIKLTFQSQSMLFSPGSFYYVRFWNRHLLNQCLLDRFQPRDLLVAWWDTEDQDKGNEKSEDKDNKADREKENGEDMRESGEDKAGLGNVKVKEREKSKQKVTFLIQGQSSLSARWARLPQTVYLDGPYGQNLQLDRYETVILVANGIGIVGILPYAQHLAERRRHDNEIKQKVAGSQKALSKAREPLLDLEANRYRPDRHASFERMMKIKQELENLRQGKRYKDLTRKVDLFWKLDENCQEQWVGDILQKMQENEIQENRENGSKKLLQVWCYYPCEKIEEPPFKIKKGWESFYPGEYELPKHIERAIDDETIKSPGRSIVITCGTTDFTQSIRHTVLNIMSWDNNIKFVEVKFQPQPHFYPMPTSIPETQPHEIYNTDKRPSDSQVGHAPPWLSKWSDSDDEDDIKLKAVPFKRPIITQQNDIGAIKAQVCVITKGEENNRIENSIKVNITDFV